jgi:hypothetical protein
MSYSVAFVLERFLVMKAAASDLRCRLSLLRMLLT